MTQEQALEALTALTLKNVRFRVSKNSLAFKTALEAVLNPGVNQVCGKNTGSGSYASSKSWKAQTIIILMRAGIPYETSNVAPLGGKSGDRIKVII